MESVSKTHHVVVVDEAWRTPAVLPARSAPASSSRRSTNSTPRSPGCAPWRSPSPTPNTLSRRRSRNPTRSSPRSEGCSAGRNNGDRVHDARPGRRYGRGPTRRVADRPGDTVTRGQIVAVVETTKAAVEIECWHDGVVDQLLVPVGETVAVGTPLATLLEPGSRPAQHRPRRRLRLPPRPNLLPHLPSPRHRQRTLLPHPSGIGCGSPCRTPHRGRTRRGSQGRRRHRARRGAITLHDVEHAAATAHHEAPKPPPPPPPAPGAAPKSAAEKARERGAAMRASIAAAMSRSKREIPAHYLGDEIIPRHRAGLVD